MPDGVKAEGSAESVLSLGLASACPATVRLSLVFSQNLPALVLKIMSGTFAPISDRYSPDLRQLILSMLNLDPSKRPQLNEIMAQAICIRPLLNLYTDVGSVKMRRQAILPRLRPSGGAARAHNASNQLVVCVTSPTKGCPRAVLLQYPTCSSCRPCGLWPQQVWACRGGNRELGARGEAR